MNAEVLMWWALVLVGLAGSAMCSGLEVGMYSVNRVRLQVRSRVQRAGSGIARLRAELEHPARVLTTLLVMNNIFNYLGTLAITVLLTMEGLGDVTIIVLQAVILTPMILIFGEAIPKELARVHADRLMPPFSWVLRVTRWVLSVLLVLPMLLALARVTARVLGVDPQNAVGSGREHMAELLKYGSGQLSEHQATLIDRALQFEHTRVRDEAEPLVRGRFVHVDWSPSRAARASAGRVGRWVPVSDASGAIVGIVSVMDLHRGGGLGIGELMKPAVRIEGNASVRVGIQALVRAGSSVGLVTVNGRDVGLVTIKDLIGPLLG